MKRTILFITSLLYAGSVFCQVGKTQTIMVSAKAISGGGVLLSWPAETFSGSFKIYKRTDLNIEDWGSPYKTLPSTASSFFDSTVLEGNSAEYTFEKVVGTSSTALGNIYAGNKLKEPLDFDQIILLIDSNYKVPLASEIQRLKTDLENEGWTIYIIYAGRTQTTTLIRESIKTIYVSSKYKLRSVFIIGHVPVPYSGYFSSSGDAPPPDGHVEGSGNHTGAWPADVFYGEMDAVWPDAGVNCTTGSSPRNHNVPGDGKFDLTKLPDKVALEVGRVDFYDMPTFTKSDTLLLKNYLNRNHNWRNGLTISTERALIDDNFTSLNLSSTGYGNFSALITKDSIFTNRDYIFSQKRGNYLWSYGCGAGSYSSCNGIGVTANFNNDSFSNIFTILAGSFFGDWDSKNNLLRAPLATSSLACFWGGIPKWYVHHMGLGMNIGYGTRLTQNNINLYYNGNFNASYNSVHIALMGDPTLRQNNINAPTQLKAVSTNKLVQLNWSPSTGTKDGYHIYKLDSVNHYIKVNGQIITDTFFTDSKNYFSGTYKYAVKAVKLETTASGSYYNISGASFATVVHVNGLESGNHFDLKISVFPNPSGSVFTIHFGDEQEQPEDLFVSDLNGKTIIQLNNNKLSMDKNIQINLDGFTSGIYFLTGHIDGKQFVKKLVLSN